MSHANGRLSTRAIAIAVAAPLLVTALKFVAYESLGRFPFLLYFASVLIATWQAGWVAGVLSTGLAALLGYYIFVPRIPIEPIQTLGQLRLTVFVIEALIITALTHWLRRVRRQANAAAHDAQVSIAKLEGVLAGLRDGITMQDQTGQLVYANDPLAQLLGFPDAATFLATPFEQIGPRYEVLREDGSPLPASELPGRRVLRGDANCEELIRFRVLPDGRETWTLVRATAVQMPGGTAPWVVNVVEDLTEKRAEERERTFLSDATRELNSSLDYRHTLAVVARLVVPSIADWCAVDLWEDGRVVRLAVEHQDPRKRELLFEMDRRYPVNLSAQSGRALALRDNKPVLVADFRESELQKVAQEEGHQQIVRELAIDSYIVVPLLAQGQTIGVLTLAMSGSGRHHSERDVRIASELAERAGLAVAHARAYDVAENARQEAERANRTKDEFMAMLGHELRNPLSPIVTAVHLMKMRRADLFERERTIIERQVRHLVRLVDDLLDVSRITRGKIELSKEPVDLNDTVARALELAAPLIEQRKHQVKLQLAPLLLVDGDPVRLAQVVANLFTNAAKYTPPGGQIEVQGERRAEFVKLTVRDNGVGVEPALLPRIFDLFVQGRQNLDRAQGGLGLGLAIVRSVVELHGGRASVHSDGPSRGSEFSIELPQGTMRKRSSIPAPAPLGLDASGRTPRVMVVDDNADALTMLSDALRTHGHEVHTAADAASALVLAEQLAPEVALLDIGLPGMDGYELARRLRQLPGLEAIKLVAVTGYGQASDKQRAFEAGFDEHLVKPISVQTLRSALDRLAAE